MVLYQAQGAYTATPGEAARSGVRTAQVDAGSATSVSPSVRDESLLKLGLEWSEIS